MAIPAVSLETPYGTIRRLSNGNYRLRNSCPSLKYLLDMEFDIFSFLVDEGFLITSFKYTERDQNGKVTQLGKPKYKMQKINTLPDYLDYMAEQNMHKGKSSLFTIIVELEKFNNAFIGAIMSEINNEVASKHNLTRNLGLLIVDLVENGPAKKAGLKKNDVLLKIDNVSVNTVNQMRSQIKKYRAGDKITCLLKRKGINKEIVLQKVALELEMKNNLVTKK